MNPKDEYTSKSGEVVHPVGVAIFDNGFTVSVEFASEADALAALGGTVPEVMADVVIPVIAQGPWDAERQRRGTVRYRGRRLAAA